MNTAIRLSPRFIVPVRTEARGIASRGNCILRTTPSSSTTDVSAFWVASTKKVNSTMFISSSTG